MTDTTVNVRTIGLQWVSRVITACRAARPRSSTNRQVYCQDVANCFYESIDEVGKANLAARQTLVALWPAMISLVAAMYPDANDVAHGSVGWAVVFAITSGGIAGYSIRKPEAHLDAPDEQTAISLCSNAESSDQGPSLPKHGSKRLHLASHGLLLFCIALYAVFTYLFLDVLQDTILTWLCEPYWFGALWVFLGGVPALMQGVAQVLFTSNTTLYLPGKSSHNTLSKFTSGSVRMWAHVVKCQLTNKPYRLCVHKSPATLARGLFDSVIATCRLAVFVFGSVTQASLILMPTPVDVVLFGLIVGMAFVPRVLWVYVCSGAVNRDTKIVFY